MSELWLVESSALVYRLGEMLYNTTNSTMRLLDYWTTEEVAEHTGYNPESVRRRAREGTIPCQRFGGRWMFPVELIKRWWAAGAPMADPKLFE